MSIKSLAGVIVLSLGSLFPSVRAGAAAVELKTGDRFFPTPPAVWEFDPSPFALKQITEGVNGRKYLHDPGRVLLCNGKTLDMLVPDRESFKFRDDALTASQEFSSLKLDVVQRVTAKDDALFWEVTLNNASAEELWIDLKLDLPAQTQPTDRYWDGAEERDVSAAPFLRKELQGTFPVALLRGSDHGLAVGVPPAPDTSFLQNGISNQGHMFYGSRFVVSPGRSEHLTFLLYVVNPILGARDAVHGYYRRFPASFDPYPGVDPRLVDGRRTDTLQLAAYDGGIKDANRAVLAMEWYGGWEWMYVPFYRDGDYVGRKEYWDLDLSEGQKKRMQADADAGSFDRTDWERFHQTRLARFRDADLRGNLAPAFYTVSHIEVALAKKLGIVDYAYSRTGNGAMTDSNWTLPYTTVYFFFPWATPYEKILRRDLPEVVKELNLTAIAHDLFQEDGRGYRGKLDYFLPGWSYDEEGKFIRLTLGHRHEADFIHSLRNGSRPLGLVVNANYGGDAISGFVADACIAELPMTTALKTRKSRDADINSRLFMGHKPMYQHCYNGGINLGDLVPWETLTGEQCRAVYDDFVRDYVIYLYQMGLAPSYSMSSAFEVIGKELPTFLEVTSRGFEPASACIGNPALERVRYGAGLGTAVVLSNRGSDSVQTLERFIPQYLGETGVVLPAEYRGGEIKFSFDARGTTFPLVVPFLENRIVSFPVALRTSRPLAGDGRCVTMLEPERRTYRITLDLKSPAQVRVAVGADTGFEFGALSCNGKPAALEQDISLPAGVNELFVETVSSIARAPMAAFAAFPFGEAAISLPDPPAERETAAAQMLQDFVKVRLGKTLTFGAPSPDQPVIRLARMAAGESRGVTVEGRTMIVRGLDPFDLQQVVWDFLRFLDRYDSRCVPSHNIVCAANASTAEMLKKAGVLGQWMRDVKPEKRLAWDGFTRPASPAAADTVRAEDLRAIAVPLLDREPLMDGKLDDEIWKKAAVADKFALLQTKAAPTQATEAWVYRTADALFIGFRCHEANMNKIVAEMTARQSEVWHDDTFEVRLAPGIKGTQGKYAYFVFLVNPIGTQTDLRWEKGEQDMKWDSHWTCKVHQDASSWSGEIRIPLNAMENHESPFWRANFSRFEKPNSEYSTWSPMNEASDPASLGIMTFK